MSLGYHLWIEILADSASDAEPVSEPAPEPCHPASLFDTNLLPSYRSKSFKRFAKLKRKQGDLPIHKRYLPGDLRRDARCGLITVEWIDVADPEIDVDAYLEPNLDCHPMDNDEATLAKDGRDSPEHIPRDDTLSGQGDDPSHSIGSPLAANGEDLSVSLTEHLPSMRLPQTLAPRSSGFSPKIVPTSGLFVPFASGKSQLNAGIVHLYRDPIDVREYFAKDTAISTSVAHGDDSGNNDDASPDVVAIPLNPDGSAATPTQLQDAKGTGTILAILAVPTYMTPPDILNFIGPNQKFVSNIRIIRDATPNRFLVLIRFRQARHADRFYKEYNGRPFSSLEPAICHVVYIKSIKFSSHAIPAYAFPANTDDPASVFLTARTNPGPPCEGEPSPSDSVRIVTHYSPRSAHPGHLVELPNCPVCLERMDASATGLLTIVCHHTFHAQCLAKWGDSTCPVCRYSQNAAKFEADTLNECADCGSTESLWICLICGNIGCGRYQSGHAQRHFELTNHLYSLELETQRVWDYAGDGYVHRLIQNKADGKLVELPAPNAVEPRGYFRDRGYQRAFFPEGCSGAYASPDDCAFADGKGANDDLDYKEKIDSIGLEYSYQLTSQLESQREWYETQIRKTQQEAQDLFEQLAQLMSQREATLKGQSESERKISKERRTLDKRLEKSGERIEELERRLTEEQHMNENLRQHQEKFKCELTERDRIIEEQSAAIQELQEQVKDLMFYLETQQRVENSELRDELREGTVVINDAPRPPAPSTSSRRKGKSRKS
ncbi:BRCA1-associated protein 2-domain-containing protein [Polychytrium aggregatum]|uniref:BRCA1-associated protein 2-domain-containing protein n=1 Tax=Polychytrium aggregatum TaxID=110093 RepID=UPI0022FEB699|nr:BRCA1-associated protein 2-domain-containing protein [Polychytrium aggregatum]KAI9193742.1 BRCA1-associated protein 2-domain-containing protein [Polychytrium aggregatum]